LVRLPLLLVVVVYRSLVGFLSVDVVFSYRSVVAFLCLSGLALVSFGVVSGVEEEDEEKEEEEEEKDEFA
jgi:hypothetical protein